MRDHARPEQIDRGLVRRRPHGVRGPRLVTTSIFHTPEEGDGMLASGMEGGMNENYARLDEVLERLASS